VADLAPFGLLALAAGVLWLICFPSRHAVERAHVAMQRHAARSRAGRYRWQRWKWAVVAAAGVLLYLWVYG
jgi:hypothetical protein